MPRLEIKKYRVSSFGQISDLPALTCARQPHQAKSVIDDYEGLFIDYGWRETAYPYTMQNEYFEESEREIQVAVLENDCLYAEFLPDFGGRLWKLYDKKRGRDVLYTNDVIRFRNLSIRNAWFSGGVEWNCGLIGHSPFTCSPMYCAFVQGSDGEEVLRFYEFERVREIYYQMDFWLEGDRLLCSVRIENQNSTVVPMYWWSNMATPEYKGGRIAVHANRAYNNSDGMGIKKSSIPFDGGIDVSYPENIPDTIDYFYDIDAKADKFIANVDADGFGLLQYSSHNLKGRKLFSWGHRKGSDHWQKMLTDQAGSYVEIQAGLGKTQYECLPMPPKCVWHFVECYTLADIGATAVQQPYDTFVNAVQAQVLSAGGSAGLDARLKDIANTICLQKGKLVRAGSGFGYLNSMLGGKIPAQLEFLPQSDVKPWLALLQNETDGELTFAYGPKMEALLLQKKECCRWDVLYQLALLHYDRRDFEKARVYCAESILLESNYKNNHLYTFILYQLQDKNCPYFAQKTLRMCTENYSLAESIFVLLLNLGAYTVLIDAFKQLHAPLQNSPRLRMYLSMAYLKTGDAKQAEHILLDDGGLVLLDFREGDRFLDELYRGIRLALYHETKVTVPEQFDFIVADFSEKGSCKNAETR